MLIEATKKHGKMLPIDLFIASTCRMEGGFDGLVMVLWINWVKHGRGFWELKSKQGWMICCFVHSGDKKAKQNVTDWSFHCINLHDGRGFDGLVIVFSIIWVKHGGGFWELKSN